MFSELPLNTNLVSCLGSVLTPRFISSLITIHHLICLLLLFLPVFKLRFCLLEFQLPFSNLSWGSCTTVLLPRPLVWWSFVLIFKKLPFGGKINWLLDSTPPSSIPSCIYRSLVMLSGIVSCAKEFISKYKTSSSSIRTYSFIREIRCSHINRITIYTNFLGTVHI